MSRGLLPMAPNWENKVMTSSVMVDDFFNPGEVAAERLLRFGMVGTGCINNGWSNATTQGAILDIPSVFPDKCGGMQLAITSNVPPSAPVELSVRKRNTTNTWGDWYRVITNQNIGSYTNDFVTKSTAQTISGKKTFTDTLTADDIYLESINTDNNYDSSIVLSKNLGLMIGSTTNIMKYHQIVGLNDDTARASFAGGAAVFNYADKSSHLKTVYAETMEVDGSLQTPILKSLTSLTQSVSSNGKFTFKTGESTPLEIYGTSANFGVSVTSSMGFFDTSDERKKNFIRPIDVDLEKLSNLKKHYFTWKDGNGEMQIGTSAQEVKELYPELVNKAEDGTLTVAYNKLSVVALAAIDKLHNENTELKKKVKTLEERLAKIESLLEENLNNL
jgi:hypothetical protein